MISEIEGKIKNIEEEVLKSDDLRDYDGLVQLKVVYWGPGESGKTTNFKFLRKNYKSFEHLTQGYSIETTDGRTLWFDVLFISFPFKLPGHKYKIVVQLITCTGQERFLNTREYVLDGADGIIFVGDSDPKKIEQNKRSFRELISFAKPKKIPYLVQLNKRDLKNAVSANRFKNQLGLPSVEKYDDNSLVIYTATALKGKGVIETFRDLALMVLFKYFTEY